jgi:hypothetical protein
MEKIEELTKEIKELEIRLEEAKKTLINLRLREIHCLINVSNINISCDESSWEISYIHNTNNFSYEYYDIDNDIPNKITSKSSNIKFGKNEKKYFIKGVKKFNIYRNSNKELRIIANDYEFELDLEENQLLIENYIKNFDIPESFALTIFLHMMYNNWDDESITNYISCI